MKSRDQSGQALVELALSLTLLLLLVFGLFEFGRAMYVLNTLNYAAREGARIASVSNPLDRGNVTNRVLEILPLSLQPGAVIAITPVAPQPGAPVKVTVRTPFSTILPELLPMLAGITSLGAEASMRYE